MRVKPNPITPAPMAGDTKGSEMMEKCGCVAIRENNITRIKFCPLHARAASLQVENETLRAALELIAAGVPGRSTAESWLSSSEMADIAAGALVRGG